MDQPGGEALDHHGSGFEDAAAQTQRRDHTEAGVRILFRLLSAQHRRDVAGQMPTLSVGMLGVRHGSGRGVVSGHVGNARGVTGAPGVRHRGVRGTDLQVGADDDQARDR